MRLLLVILLLGLSTQITAYNGLLYEEIPHHLYMGSLNECDDCITYTIIISDMEVNKNISGAFKSITDSFGKKHAGAIVKWSDALKNYRFFKNNKCGSFTDLAENVLIYIDKNEAYCERFSYDNQPQLVAMISIISINLGELKNIKNETWRLRTKQAIDTYAKENKVVAATKQTAYKFIDYVGDLLLEYRK